MVYSGEIKNGVAVLTPPASLPEGTRVRIEVERGDAAFRANKSVDQLAKEQGVNFGNDLSKINFDWPEDESTGDLMALVRQARR